MANFRRLKNLPRIGSLLEDYRREFGKFHITKSRNGKLETKPNLSGDVLPGTSETAVAFGFSNGQVSLEL